jgi:F420-0:gamma-glutamyl ligase
MEVVKDVSTLQQTVLQHIEAAIDKSDRSDRQKRVAKRRLKRPRVQELVLDEVVARGYVEQYITVSDENEILVDWEGIIAFIERILPLILQLIGLFG